MARKKAANRSFKSPLKSSKLLQTTLNIPGSEIIKKCVHCEMTYSLNSPSDIIDHKKFHDMHLNGRQWAQVWGHILISYNNSIVPITTFSSTFKRNLNIQTNIKTYEHIVSVSPNNLNEVKATLEILEVVNNELKAPHDENDFWMKDNKGKVFVYVKDGRCIGIITVEYLAQTQRGRWMVLETRDIVPNIFPNVKIGISRIWVCKNERNKGIAKRLLETARNYTILGSEIKKWELAWSQPSESGGILAKSYNSVIHKSGKVLIPCYI